MSRPHRCSCGRVPAVRTRAIVETQVKTWVECPNIRCRATGPEIEDATRDDASAVALWNAGGGRKS